MIALVCKNLARLISKHSSSVYRSPVFFSLPLHFFSTGRERQLVTSTKVFDVLVHKHQFSPEVASLVASHLTQCRSPEKADIILSFLEESGFSSTQLQKIMIYKPRILSARIENIKFKIKLFQELGLSSHDIAKIISSHQVILESSAKNKIIPTLSLLKRLLGSNHDVARLLRASGRIILADLDKTLVPNVEILKTCGIPMERIHFILYSYPRCLLIKPDIMRKSIEKAKEMGFSPSSNMFIHGVRVLASVSKGIWEVKLQALRDLGCSDSDILTMFRKAPQVFSQSINKIEKIKELLLATGKFDISSIISNPSSLGFSIEKRYKPRLQTLGILESKNLIKKWPSLGTICLLSDDKFFNRYVKPYPEAVGKLYVTKSYVKGNKAVNL